MGKVLASNRKAKFDYEILEIYEAGIILKGAEVKSIRQGSVSLKEGFVRPDDRELFLVNVHISPYKFSRQDLEPRRKRKLLLHRKEIDSLLAKASQKGLTLMPLELYFKKGKVKVKIGLGRGRKKYDKRKVIKEREDRKKMRVIKKEKFV